jgi:hypothetical protein
MWWCCGRRELDAPGCKFAKHESKEDEEDENDEGNQELKFKNKKLRCHCCKEIGHSANDCLRDPNMRTYKDLNEEDNRIAKTKGVKKLLVDSLDITSRFFKGLIRRNVASE